MARPDCPRCGSDLIVAVPSRAPSQLVLELRGGSAPAVARGDGPAHWLCRSCGHRWDPEVHPDTSLLEPQHLQEPADREMASRPAPEAETDAEPHVSPGTALRTAREERGKTLAQASRATGVWTDQLEALERDAPLEEFPAPAYARLYLREYARFLRLDPEPLLQDLDALNPVVEEPTFEPLPDTRGRRKIVAGVLAVLSVVALIVIALNQTGSRRDAGTTPAGAAPVTTHDSGHVPLVGEAARPPTGVRAVLRLTEPSWVQAISDGEVVAAATLQPGEVVGYRARKLLQLTLGNAGGVRLRVNGERVETGTQGEVVTLDLRLRDGTISTARA